MSAIFDEWKVDPWDERPSSMALRENNCIQLLTVLEAHDGEAWSLSTVAAEALIPSMTARRLLFPEVMEIRSYDWFTSLRNRANLSTQYPAAEFTTNLVGSYYGRILANATYLGRVDGREVVRVNTSQFELLQRIGAKYEYYVTFDPSIRAPGRGPKGRARARYVVSGFRWSSEDRLDPEGYRVTW